jgi:hypothetical protein
MFFHEKLRRNYKYRIFQTVFFQKYDRTVINRPRAMAGTVNRQNYMLDFVIRNFQRIIADVWNVIIAVVRNPQPAADNLKTITPHVRQQNPKNKKC